MALNNMTNTPEAVEEHIRKQIEGSGIGQVMAQAILAAQKPKQTQPNRPTTLEKGIVLVKNKDIYTGLSPATI